MCHSKSLNKRKDKTLIGAPSVISKGWLSADISGRHEQEIEEQLSSELKSFLESRKELTQEVLEQKLGESPEQWSMTLQNVDQ